MKIINQTNLTLNRPEPITETIPVLEYFKEIDPKHAVNELLEGNHVLISDQFSSGLLVLNALKERLSKNANKQTFEGQRNFRDSYRKASQLLLIEISNYRLQVKKAPEIGWFKILYAETPEFLLPFTDVQGLNSSWQWYEKGIRIPGLKQLLHPFYGTYFPTRFEHIELFVDYLRKYKGAKENAFDIGIGSGVLSKLFHQFGFNEVHASDINPNALIGTFESEKESNQKTNLYFGDLFAHSKIKSDLIAFNPPWIPLPKEVSGIDLAIYYDKDLFPRFFEEAHKHLNSEGNVVLLFSNLAGLMDPKFIHPIELELKSKKRFELVEKTTKKVAAASSKTKRKANWRDHEFVECWVLGLI
ncbi:methyltransferase [Fluviicola taffensis]|uniref:Polypeptide chain release factor methylase n=1 Tax=Fluviicola taffensis (strain DSM 16823 / NCIMB 13979 / RW262) TaxID=755732 RepID=F2IA64_FLUTR|nr:methyltransferase [Fluviicola taffensis]AEA45241.1 polypeptide chain release factor methylase [Fluviicola taffensis DSM 16823]